MSTEQAQIGAAIAALENQRSLLGDAVVDMAVAPLKAKLAALRGAAVSAAEPAEPAQTLKQVTILFLDVVGSTTLAQHLPSAASRLRPRRASTAATMASTWMRSVTSTA